jgi:hypothetical protein
LLDVAFPLRRVARARLAGRQCCGAGRSGEQTNASWRWRRAVRARIGWRRAPDYPGAVDIDFDNAAGALVEAGWNWVGLQCTYMKYHTDVYGSFDASNCGIRFTFRFRKWCPIS